ncbi:UNVERIFIED_CONTAM: Oxysterol-binding protein-related protein 2A [Sesamum radiatum]|uniref:Oxysterol-binding protein-related protein 2A n=1 Tax=Sesamum radiatum TaxID=300843 RepID=A0AAW2ME21_SESRA
MWVKELHPLCCIPLESPEIGAESPEPTLLRTGRRSISSAVDLTSMTEDLTSVPVLAWLGFYTSGPTTARAGDPGGSHSAVTAFSLTPRRSAPTLRSVTTSLSLAPRSQTAGTAGNTAKMSVSSFRESKADDRRFDIFTATKTLHLRTNTKKERLSWIQALISIRSLFQLRPQIGATPHLIRNLSISTERLKRRLLEEGIGEGLVKECEQIMLSELSQVEGQFQVLSEERSSLLDTLRQLEEQPIHESHSFFMLYPCEVLTYGANIEAEVSGINGREYELMKQEYTNLARGKYSEWSTTESSDDVGKQELEEASDEEETHFFDTNDYFLEPTFDSGLIGMDHVDNCEKLESHQTDDEEKSDVNKNALDSRYPHVERRKRLPDPIEKEKGVSLWSMIKDNIGKDLTRVCLPVYFNEPISSLQKCFEDLEYSHLLDQAYKHGKEGNSVMRILSVAAFAVSGYASSEGRHCKPFNPLLGETYEADYPEKGIRFFSEKVSHHPTVIACHCEGKGWKFWCDTNLKSKFWGRSIQLDPVGTLNLEFDDGEIFQWSKVTTSIYNLILGNIYCDHHGTMHIQGNREYSCKLKFKEQSILDRNPHQVHGFVEDATGNKVSKLFGKWDDSMYFINGDGTGNGKGKSEASLLWKRNKPSPNPTRYNLTSFAITLNELTPGLKEKLPPTDSRLRPDQRYLENGEYDKANAEKLRLEMRQRMSRKLQEHGWKPKWFHIDGKGAFHYVGGYWEARQQANWDGCPDIFGEISQDLINSLEDS